MILFDTIQKNTEQKNLNSSIIVPTIQFHAIEYNSQN
jgi:hypothetical protein